MSDPNPGIRRLTGAHVSVVNDLESRPTAVSIEHLVPAQAYQDLSPAQREAQSMNRIGQLACAAMGPVMLILFVIGAVWLAGYWPPQKLPGANAVQVLDWYAKHNTRLKVGLVFMTSAYAVMCFYGVVMAVQTRRKEGAYPVWTYLQLTCTACGTAQIVIMGAAWAAAAFRAAGCSSRNPCHLVRGSAEFLAYAHDVQMMHDFGWMILLGTWMPFTIWNIALGMAILLDKTDTPVFPRWSGYLSLLSGVSYALGSGCWFFFEGAMGWNGLLALYYVFAIFGFWVLYFAWASYKNVQRGYVHQQDILTA
jgi:hypothetical protein